MAKLAVNRGKPMPNVLVVSRDFQKLGEVFIYRQVNGMKRFHPVILTWHRLNEDVFPYDSVAVLHSPGRFRRVIEEVGRRVLRWDIGSHFRRRAIKGIIQQVKPQVIHIHFGWMASEYLKYYHVGDIPVAVTFHGSDIMVVAGDHIKLRDLREIVFRRADQLIFVSDFLRSQAIELGCPRDKAVVNYLGAPIVDQIPERRHGNALQGICVARFVPFKGHRFLLEAVKRAADKGASIRLDLIGDGPLRDRIAFDVERLGLSDVVRFAGIMDQSDVLKRLLAADMYIQHSATPADGQAEALGISIAEAMSCALPVVATRSGGIPEMVVDGVTGILVDEYDVEGMARAIVELSRDVEKRLEMGAQGRKRIRAQFSVEAGVDALEGIFGSMVENRNSAANDRAGQRDA